MFLWEHILILVSAITWLSSILVNMIFSETILVHCVFVKKVCKISCSMLRFVFSSTTRLRDRECYVCTVAYSSHVISFICFNDHLHLSSSCSCSKSHDIYMVGSYYVWSVKKCMSLKRFTSLLSIMFISFLYSSVYYVYFPFCILVSNMFISLFVF